MEGEPTAPRIYIHNIEKEFELRRGEGKQGSE
jgi:hypothetical protein